jgi:hypothetical protein
VYLLSSEWKMKSRTKCYDMCRNVKRGECGMISIISAQA